MPPKVKTSFLAVGTALSVFIIFAEWIDQNGIDGIESKLLYTLILSITALAGGAFVFWWFQRTRLSGNLFVLSRMRVVAAKRFSIVFGALIGAPVFTWLCYVNIVPEGGPVIAYVLATPGMMILGHIVVASLVHSVFWCLDGFGETEKNDRSIEAIGQIPKEADKKSTTLNQLAITPQETSKSTTTVVADEKIQKKNNTSSLVLSNNMHDVRSIGGPEKNPSSNYLILHWRGELPLAVTYWANGFLVLFAQSAILTTMAEMKGNYPLRIVAVAGIGATLFSFAVWLWLVVGIWRSADRHVSLGTPHPWAKAAKFMVVIGLIGVAFALPKNVAPYVNELALIASGNDPIGNFEISVAANGRSVIVHGPLREGSAAKIQTILDAAPSATLLVLNSNGGRLAEAQQLALTVRERHLDTYVKDECVSACTFVFLAGKDRAATPNARIGFHQPSFPGMDTNTHKSMTQDMLDSYLSAGLPKSFLQHIGKTSPEDMWYPTHDELITSNVITRVSLGGDAATIGLDVRSSTVTDYDAETRAASTPRVSGNSMPVSDGSTSDTEGTPSDQDAFFDSIIEAEWERSRDLRTY